MLAAAEHTRIRAYVVLSLLTRARTAELRALTWDHVDLNGKPDDEPPVPPHVAAWRSGKDSSGYQDPQVTENPRIAEAMRRGRAGAATTAGSGPGGGRDALA